MDYVLQGQGQLTLFALNTGTHFDGRLKTPGSTGLRQVQRFSV